MTTERVRQNEDSMGGESPLVRARRRGKKLIGEPTLIRCDSVHREGKSWWRCARIAGHEGRHHFATKDWR